MSGEEKGMYWLHRRVAALAKVVMPYDRCVLATETLIDITAPAVLGHRVRLYTEREGEIDDPLTGWMQSETLREALDKLASELRVRATRKLEALDRDIAEAQQACNRTSLAKAELLNKRDEHVRAMSEPKDEP